MKYKTLFAGMCMAAALMLCTGMAEPRQGVAIPLNVGGSCVLVDETGAELVPAGVYDSIDLATSPNDPQGELFAAYLSEADPSGDQYVALDADGQRLDDQRYTYFTVEQDGSILCLKDGLYGVQDRQMNQLIPCQYTALVPNGEGGYLALTTDPYDERADGVYYLNERGEESATGIRILYGLAAFSEGLMPVTSAESGRMGYLDAHGQWAISAQYSYAGDFSGGCAEAEIESGCGLIDVDGNWLLTPKYMQVSVGKGGAPVLAAVDNTQVQLLDPVNYAVKQSFTGEEVYAAAYLDGDFGVVYADSSTLLIDAEGQVLCEAGINATFDSYMGAGERLILHDGEWGETCVWLIDAKGERLSGPWQDVMPVGVEGGQTLYAVSAFETELVPMQRAEWSYYEEVPGTRRTALVDRNGEEVLPMDAYEEIICVRDGYFNVRMDGTAGVLNAQGEWVVQKPLELESEEEIMLD